MTNDCQHTSCWCKSLSKRRDLFGAQEMTCKWRALRVNLQRFQCDESQAVPDLSIYLPLRFRIWIPGTLQGSPRQDQLAAVNIDAYATYILASSSFNFLPTLLCYHHFLLTLETATVHSVLLRVSLFLVINSYKFYSINILFVIRSILSIQSR